MESIIKLENGLTLVIKRNKFWNPSKWLIHIEDKNGVVIHNYKNRKKENFDWQNMNIENDPKFEKNISIGIITSDKKEIIFRKCDNRDIFYNKNAFFYKKYKITEDFVFYKIEFEQEENSWGNFHITDDRICIIDEPVSKKKKIKIVNEEQKIIFEKDFPLNTCYQLYNNNKNIIRFFTKNEDNCENFSNIYNMNGLLLSIISHSIPLNSTYIRESIKGSIRIVDIEGKEIISRNIYNGFEVLDYKENIFYAYKVIKCCNCINRPSYKVCKNAKNIIYILDKNLKVIAEKNLDILEKISKENALKIYKEYI